MGYYTTFELTVDKRHDEVDMYLSASKEDYPYLSDFESWGESWGMNSKWRSDHADMCTLSAAFPDVLFTLTGEGEDTGDIWRSWYREGKMIDNWELVFDIPSHPFYRIDEDV